MIFHSKKINKIPGLKSFFFTRNIGLSHGIYKSLNCGLGSNDKKKIVKKNITIISKKTGCKLNKLIMLKQYHSNKIINIGVKRLDTQKLYHGLFYMYNNLRSKTIMKAVISDIPYFLSLMVNLEDTLQEKKIKEIQTDEYVYSFN